MSAYDMQRISGHAAQPSSASAPCTSTTMTNKLNATNDQSTTVLTSTTTSTARTSLNSWTTHPQRTGGSVTTRPPMIRGPNPSFNKNNDTTNITNTTSVTMERSASNTFRPTFSGPRHSVPDQQHHYYQEKQQSPNSLQGHPPRHKLQETEGNSSSSSNSSGKDFTAQLLQFVGLPTNLAGRLAPQNFEQKKHIKQTPLSLQNIAKPDAVVPKPGAPLPANLVDDIKGTLPSNPIGMQVPSTSSTASKRPLGLPTDSVPGKGTSKPNNISGILRHTSSFSSSTNVKRMSFQDYKSSRDTVRTTTNDNDMQSKTVTSQADTSYIARPAHVALNAPEKDAEGFVIPNASISVAHKVYPVINTSPTPASFGNVTENEPVIVDSGVNDDVNVDQCNNSSDELDTSLDELVIDESMFADSTKADDQQQDNDEQNSNDNDPYQPKSKKDITQLSMELDELYNSLDTDGSLLMDRKMRRKLRKLMRRQRRREERAKRCLDCKDDENMSSDEDDDNHHEQHSEPDVKKDEIDYPPETPNAQSCGDNEKSSQKKDNPRFKMLKHKHIVRKYRQRELEEDKRQKRRGREPLSEGELSSDASENGVVESGKGSPSKESDESKVEFVNTKSKERVSQELDLDYWESNWIEDVPDSPSELQVTFTVQVNVKSQEIPVGKRLKKTLAERSGGSFRGEELGYLLDGEIGDGVESKKSPRRKRKSPDVIEILDHETFLDNNSKTSGKEDDVEIVGHKSSKLKHRRRRRSSKQSGRRSRSQSHSPRKERSPSRSPLKGRRRSRHSKSGSRSPSQKGSIRSNSRSPRRDRKRRDRKSSFSSSRSRSCSPTTGKHGSLSYSRSPSRRNKNRHRRNERPRSRSHSRSPKRKRSRSGSPSKCDSKSDSKSSQAIVDDDRNLEDLSMEISSGEDTPPLSINTDKASEDDVSKKLEEAMAKLKKMEESVSKRQLVIEDLENETSDNEVEEVPEKSEKTEEMDQQLIDAIHRLQKMEETYSQRQRLLNSLRRSMLNAENEGGLHEHEEKEGTGKREPRPLPQVNQSTSAADQQQVPTSQVSKEVPSAKHSIVPTTSTLPGSSNQQVPKQSRWDKRGKKAVSQTATRNHPPPVGNAIPSHVLERPPLRPPPPVRGQRPPWDSNRPHHHGNHHGPPPPAANPPGPATRAHLTPKPQPSQSKHQIVWLVGSSILCQAARYVAQGPVGLGLMLTHADLVWHGRDDLKWADFGPLLARLMGSSMSPSVLVVHMDALELARVSFQDLAQQAVESLLEFNRRNPNCRIIWSEALPCCHYPGSIAKMTMEQVRINYNVMCGKLVLSLGGQIIKHTAIRPETSALFNEDKMHLSDLGNNIFLNNLRRGLAFLLNEPKTKVYSGSDDRTY